MKKYAVAFITAFICLNVSFAFAQARRVTAPTETGKTNKRPVQTSPTPTPTPTPVDENTTNIESVIVAETAGTTDDGEVINFDTDLVTIPVKVSDRKNRFIAGLTKDSFKVFEDGVEQEVALFSNEQQPFTVALVLDMSYSATFKITEIQSAAIEFINQLRKDDKVMVVAFDQDVHLLTEPTTDRERIYRAIKSTKINYGTSLYEAVDLVINAKFRKMNGRKAMVLFTDGVDTSSRKARDWNNLSDASELDALIYPIQYDTYSDVQSMKNKTIIEPPKMPSPIPSKNKNPLPFPMPSGGIGTADSTGTTAEDYRKAGEYLDGMANQTGGRVYAATTAGSLTQAFVNIANELREFYSIGYYPKNAAAPGKKRRIKVKVNQENVSVRAREGYVVGKVEKAKK